MPCRRSTRWIALGLALTIALGATSPAVHAEQPPTSVVTMGDSYISGEGGRWIGNGASLVGDHDRTDRACVRAFGLCTSYDERLVYLDGTAADGCHRSDVAEVLSARLPVDRKVNLACSGAVTENLLRASSGGKPVHGEAPQADRLLPVAQSTRIRMIVVSVGGNDLGFAPLVERCFGSYLTYQPACSTSAAGALPDAALERATTKIERVIDEIRAVMAGAGYAPTTYRLVLQTYPVVLPRAAAARYAELDPRRIVDGCPFYDADMDWANDTAAPRIGRAVKDAARSRGTEVLELLRAFDGHEICAKTTAAASPLVRPSPIGSEWGRAVSASTLAQGQELELFHPNAYGQQALGTCVGKLYAARRGSYACTGSAGHGPADMSLKPLRPAFKRRS